MKSHGASGYRGGCRCQKCRSAESARQRRFRARNPNAQIRGVPRVVALPSIPQQAQAGSQGPGPGEVEQATREQLAGMPKAAERQGEARAAIRLAQLLDDPAYFALSAQNANKLHMILTSLGTPKRKARSRLAAVESMTSRTRKAANER